MAAVLAAATAIAEAIPDSETAMLLVAVATERCTSASAAIDGILAWLKGHPTHDPLCPILVAAHLAASTQPTLSAQLLKSDVLPEGVRFAPALVATRVAVLERQGNGAAKEELDVALAWWERQPMGDERVAACCACLEHLGALCLRQGDVSAAAAAMGKLQVCTSMPFVLRSWLIISVVR
jgi:hypothetical protein